MKMIDLLQGVSVALAVIQARLLTFVAMLITAVFTGWAMWLQTALAAMIALGWGLVIFLPVLFHGRGGTDVPEAPQHAEKPPDSG